MSFASITTAFGLGFVYFISAIPVSVAAGAPAAVAALFAWLGYSAGAAIVLLAGAPLRDWIVRKLRLPVQRDPAKFIWRAWDRWGLGGLGLLAPVTIGPQAGAIIALGIGEKPLRIFGALAVGVVPWCVGLAVVASLGVKLFE